LIVRLTTVNLEQIIIPAKTEIDFQENNPNFAGFVCSFCQDMQSRYFSTLNI